MRENESEEGEGEGCAYVCACVCMFLWMCACVKHVFLIAIQYACMHVCMCERVSVCV